MAEISGNADILAKALRDMLMAWDQTELGWRDQARAEFEKEYVEEIRLSAKAALGSMTEITEFLNQARRECG